MKNKTLWLILISLGGVLFSGYLSLSKIFSGVCPLSEGCPLFLGYPACYTGFIIFFTLFLLSLFKQPKAIKIVSFLGILFAFYSTYIDLVYPSCPSGICRYSLLLPTCVYGLVMYLSIFILSLKLKK